MSTPPVIVAVDGSDDSLRALEWALDAARVREAPLRVVHVRQYAAWGQPDVLVAGPPDPVDDPVLDQVRTHLESRPYRPAAEYLGLPDRPAVEYLALEGAPGAVIPELGSGAQLLVLGSRGRGGFASLLLGSNGMAAARDAECPVVVVERPGREVPDAPVVEAGPRVVVGVHVEHPDDATLTFAFTEAARRKARVHVIAAYPWPVPAWTAPGDFASAPLDSDAVEEATRTLAEDLVEPHRERHPDLRVDVSVPAGDAAGHLVAASPDADLVVVGRHRRRLFSPVRLLGSVTQAVLLHATSPVAVVPPAPAEED
ncbi:universal stress protein [Streptomyces sp. NPDC059785]|uniref:universal stress protein n=1 Tax=unclassified Streptomyces TaxID=2593676 RepID=UPI00365F5E85